VKKYKRIFLGLEQKPAPPYGTSAPDIDTLNIIAAFVYMFPHPWYASYGKTDKHRDSNMRL